METLPLSDIEPMQACSFCLVEHPVSHYAPAGPGQRRKTRCESCRTKSPEYRRIVNERNPEYARRSNMLRLYDVTPEQFDEMREAQDYRCAICGVHEDDIPRVVRGRKPKNGRARILETPLHVDHNHTTNANRGLLCSGCNIGIGQFQEDTERLRAAIAYLEAHALSERQPA